MSNGISVVICCHNSARRLPETLRHLAAQRVSENIPWEVLIIDNASTDGTTDMARRCWPEFSLVPLRIVPEPKLGIGNARFKSFSRSALRYHQFYRRRNWVEPDWIGKVSLFFGHHSEISAVIGPSRTPRGTLVNCFKFMWDSEADFRCDLFEKPA
jgi:cellulose synthase/poly-beta-1,6-N-acetylglucosamine synthase-like glycosyltransferase